MALPEDNKFIISIDTTEDFPPLVYMIKAKDMPFSPKQPHCIPANDLSQPEEEKEPPRFQRYPVLGTTKTWTPRSAYYYSSQSCQQCIAQGTQCARCREDEGY